MYLKLPTEQAAKGNLEVVGWFLMRNHVHRVAIPHN